MTQSQQRAFDKIKAFLGNDNDSDIFVLKGYAGTGKTHLIKHIVNYLEEEKDPFEVLAPTGRASKVLRERVGYGRTIHSCIYSRELVCLNSEDSDNSRQSFKLVFPILKSPEDFHIIIVDESSMVSNVKSENEFFTFGSGILLADLLQFCKVCGIDKLIFVGDPAQLPPVMDPHSCALDVEYLSSLGHRVETDELTEVVRQKADSLILKQATKLRDTLKLPRDQRRYLMMETDGDQVIELPATDLPERYTDVYPVPEVGDGITVCYSNRRCYEVNQAVRSILHGEEMPVQVGDIVINSSNNYKTYDIPLYNGDMAKVTAVGEVEWHRGIPVTIKKEKRHIDLAFRDLDLFMPDWNATVRCKVFDDLLHSPEPRLSVWQIRAAYIDFIMRNPKLKSGTPEFKDALLQDRYFNALEVKFGYAVTCHKSQGGEWDTVFVDYSGRIGLSDDHLRWCYTATTRAKNRLYAIHMPHITSFDHLSFTAISRLAKAPKDFWQDDDTLATTYHPATDLMGVRLKHLGIEEALKATDFKLVNVEICSWQDKFDFESSTSERVHIEVYYDGAGFFKLLPLKGDGSSRDMLCQLINTSMAEPRHFHYEPGNELMQELFQRVVTAAADTDVKIVNVTEVPQQHYVRYYLVTDARFAVITFYNTDRDGFTTAMPMSELGPADEKLKKLIENIEDKH